jgi:succinyl-diaminopimelate desuccinylase
VNETLALALALIRRPSVTPDDADCQVLLTERLRVLGFDITPLPFGRVSNFWARYGTAPPLVVLAGHTDVVPPGPADAWESPPFEPVVRDGYLYGRGASDMKSSLAAMVVACERLLGERSRLHGSIGFLITSDEEGDAVDGTARVVDHLVREGIQIDHCIVGEPSSSTRTGDVVRNGRRGSLSGHLVVRGVQGHVAYPEQVVNPIHQVAPALAELAARTWDAGNDYFPATSFQISNIHAGTGATNVVPGTLEAQFNFRFNSEQTPDALKRAVAACFDAHGLDHTIRWNLSGAPFLTARGPLTGAVSAAIEGVMGFAPELSTSGGTSDGRFIAPTGAGVVEIGPVNATIHKVNERIAVRELEDLTAIYHAILKRLLVPSTGADAAGGVAPQ